MLLNSAVDPQDFTEVQESDNTKFTVTFPYIIYPAARAVVEVIKENGANLKYRLLPSTKWIEITDSNKAIIVRDEASGVVVVKWAEDHWCTLASWVEQDPKGMTEIN